MIKSTKAMKNVRLFKNAQNGKPKRVNTATDDYGNRVYVVKKKNGETKIRSAGGIYGAKKQLNRDFGVGYSPTKKSASYSVNDTKDPVKLKKAIRHEQSLKRRNQYSIRGKDKTPDSNTKYMYHLRRRDALNLDHSASRAKGNIEAKELHGGKRKAKVFTPEKKVPEGYASRQKRADNLREHRSTYKNLKAMLAKRKK